MHKNVQAVTDRIILRSSSSRADYLRRIDIAGEQAIARSSLSCGNLAHGFAACSAGEKEALRSLTHSNIAIVSSYNDMLSAHQPYQDYPQIIKEAIAATGGVAQFAGGVPAMCDGVTQGQPGMDLSLMSRDVIALSAAVALSHHMFDGMLMLGICDKIVPGLFMAALAFGHLPALFVPAGPMPSGLPNKEKARVRKLYAEGKIGSDELLQAESESYHAAGTCTFYGTANSNQLVMEIMGMQLPGASFVNPGTPLRTALTRAAARQVTRMTKLSGNHQPVGAMIDERSFVNGIVGLLASGGSTNHTLHLVAMARAAGIKLAWEDFAELSACVPLLARIYPNGQADINHFQQAGGMPALISSLLAAGLLHADASTVTGKGLDSYTLTPDLVDDEANWQSAATTSKDTTVLADINAPFQPTAGLKVLKGNLGTCILKTSALPDPDIRMTAPAVVFSHQDELDAAFKAGALDRDCVVVVRFQGPKARGMPELHKLTPPLSVLQDRGYKVALVTDGRMSGASGNVPAAIHLTPEAVDGGLIACIRNGDPISLDAVAATLSLDLDAAELAQRVPAKDNLAEHHIGTGRELFGNMRRSLGRSDTGACSLFD